MIFYIVWHKSFGLAIAPGPDKAAYCVFTQFRGTKMQLDSF